jgi:hypothetical protein
MPAIFDADGDAVDENELEHGDVVYDDAGTEFVFVEDEEDDDEEVGKAGSVIATTRRGSRTAARASGHARGTANSARNRAGAAAERTGAKGRSAATQAGMHTRALPDQARAHGSSNAARGRELGEKLGRKADSYSTAAGMQYRAIPAGGRKAIKYGAGAAAVGGVGGAGYSMHKSLGDEVLSDLSKAFTDNDRDEVIAKAMDYIGTVASDNEDLRGMVEAMQDQRGLEDFTELAKSYELPIDPDSIGGLMQRASQYMDEDDVATMDRLFSSMGEFAKNDGYAQIGYDGQGTSDILDEIYAVAGQELSKGDTSLTQEQAVTALFSANPEAYEQYESDQRNYR